jgi:hypothetical protein
VSGSLSAWMSVHMCAYTSGAAGVGVVYHTLTEPEGCFPDVKSMRACLLDVVPNYVSFDSIQDLHALVANKHQIVFGGLYP